MKKPILVLQFRTDSSLEHERECLYVNGKFEHEDLVFINIADTSEEIPQVEDLKRYMGVILGGSAQFDLTSMPSFLEKRIKATTPFIRHLIELDFPSLYICFGEQLLAKIYGGRVEKDLKQAESGTHKVHLTKHGKKDKIFKDIPSSFYVFEAHKDSVTKLPQDAIHLGYSDKCKYQVYKLGKNNYAVQFHPEIDKERALERIALYPEYLKNSNLDEITKNYKNTAYATKIIENWREFVIGGREN